MTGIAGFGNCQLYLPTKGVHTCIDFHGKTPLAATADMWEDRLESETGRLGFVLKDNVNDIGYQRSLRLGAHGIWPSHRTIRNLRLERCLPTRHGSLRRASRYAPKCTPGGTMVLLRRVQSPIDCGLPSPRQLHFHDNGALKHFGDHFTNPDLAQTLTRIADHGWRTFYEGDIAEEIAADMAAHGGLLSREDLAKYQTTVTTASRQLPRIRYHDQPSSWGRRHAARNAEHPRAL